MEWWGEERSEDAYVTEAIAHWTEEVERQIAELTEFKEQLDRLRERVGTQPPQETGSGHYCHIIEGPLTFYRRLRPQCCSATVTGKLVREESFRCEFQTES